MPATLAPTFTPAIAALCRHYDRRAKTADALGQELERILEHIPAETDIALAPPSGAPHPITRHIASALTPKDGRIEGILAPLREVVQVLPWRYGYAPRADAPGLEDNGCPDCGGRYLDSWYWCPACTEEKIKGTSNYLDAKAGRL